jgi:adenosine deaminase
MGQGWQVVPEAFFYKKREFSEVHCLTTSSNKVNPEPVLEFFRQQPNVRFTISRVVNFNDLKTNEDHQRFEEVLFRWYLQHLSAARHLPYVCLAGGYKSISAALQKAAGLFGATEIFHVLAEPPPQTLEEIETAAVAGVLKFISLGTEPGWSRLRTLEPENFPLQKDISTIPVIKVDVPDLKLGALIRDNLSLISRRAEGWDLARDLPFASLALWQPRDADWLRAPLDPDTDAEWVRRLPKIELHCHLGGFATHGHLLEQVRAAAETQALTAWPEPPVSPKDWPRPAEPISLREYMRLGDNTGSRLLKDRGCLKRHVELLYQHLLADGVLYGEIRCSPNNYGTFHRSAWDVLEEIRKTFQRCMDYAKASDKLCHVNLIVIATRKQGGDLSDISRHLALAITSAQHICESGCCRVVGVDLAGYEAVETRAAYFAPEFTGIHRCGIAVTVHAGENDDAEGIWQAVFKLHARRLGHALHLNEAPDLQRTVIERRIGVEMCPFANYQIKGFEPMSNRPKYPLLEYLRSGVPVTVNTDNIGISAASLSENLLFLARLCPGITRLELLRLQANALDVAFASHPERQEVRGRLETFLVKGPALRQ